MAERGELVSTLDALIMTRLFGPGKWLGDRESDLAIQALLVELDLEEIACPSAGTRRNTALGNELNVDLLMVFLGLWEPWDAITVLQDSELIDEAEAQELSDALAARRDAERLLRRRVQTAYFKHFGFRRAH